MEYYKNILIIFFLFIVLNIQGQQILSPNIVQNPSFEQYDTCPNNEGELHYAKYWWGYSADYFNVCADIYDGVPTNWFGFQYAHTGIAYAGACIYDGTSRKYRETIKTILIDTLIVNKRYCTNFYVSLAEVSYQSLYAYYVLLDTIGMLFTRNSVQDTVLPILNNGIKVQNSILNIDTINWLKISNSFIANGGEHYLAIGNFEDIINYPTGQAGLTYVYIDDVSVCECSFKFSLGNDTTLCEGETLQLKVSMPNATYTWQDGSHANTYTVTHAGTYYVSAYFADYNITTTDTIVINYINCDTLNTNYPIYIPNAFTPTGANNNIFKIVTLAEFSEFNMTIYYRWYGKLFESEDKNKGWDGTYRGKLVTSGVYVYLITGTIKETGENIKRTGTITVVR